ERGSGLGTRLIEWAVDTSRREGCQLVQLTSDRTRTDARRPSAPCAARRGSARRTPSAPARRTPGR
ncbi:GNAT family N-acetyltransferase, partial [Streptomyces sp. NPDC056149]|uniref:GNAT family N-acetyltransferase n=1 Tax=Streptomyces sp. NPDC056149 TaxID=3345728 RepID=UPI0035D87E3C